MFAPSCRSMLTFQLIALSWRKSLATSYTPKPSGGAINPPGVTGGLHQRLVHRRSGGLVARQAIGQDQRTAGRILRWVRIDAHNSVVGGRAVPHGRAVVFLFVERIVPLQRTAVGAKIVREVAEPNGCPQCRLAVVRGIGKARARRNVGLIVFTLGPRLLE